MPENIIQFPGNKVTPEDILKDLTERIGTGKIKYLMVVTMDDITSVKCAMSTLPAFNAVYMNQLQRMTIEALMRDNGMLP